MQILSSVDTIFDNFLQNKSSSCTVSQICGPYGLFFLSYVNSIPLQVSVVNDVLVLVVLLQSCDCSQQVLHNDTDCWSIISVFSSGLPVSHSQQQLSIIYVIVSTYILLIILLLSLNCFYGISRIGIIQIKFSI